MPRAESHGGVEQSGVEEATVKSGWEETEGEKLELGSGTSYIYGLWWPRPNIHMVVNLTG